MNMIIRKRLFSLLAMLVVMILTCNAAETATSILDKAAEKVKMSKSLNASYTITADGHKQNGTLTISGDRFTISSPQISSWYDGEDTVDIFHADRRGEHHRAYS